MVVGAVEELMLRRRRVQRAQLRQPLDADWPPSCFAGDSLP